jgi:LysM repeat protein
MSLWLKKIVKPFFCFLFLMIVLFYTFYSEQHKQDIFILEGEQERENSISALCQGDERKDFPDIYSLGENSLKAISASAVLNFNTLAVFGSQGLEKGHDETGISEYFVQKGDTLSSIAQKFEITLNTLLWANELSNSSVISPGDKLIILPINGAMYIVNKGDTLSEIAELYKAKILDIADYNNLGEGREIFIGDILIIPGGEKPKTVRATPVYVKNSVPNSYFICPVSSPYWITQGLHWYNAIDFSTGKCGSPIYATAGGTVQRTGYDSRAGRYVRILHPNGVVTFYGHMSKIVATAGKTVSQGEIIGYIGYSGHTIPAGPSGCHLHFDVRGAKNPFDY